MLGLKYSMNVNGTYASKPSTAPRAVVRTAVNRTNRETTNSTGMNRHTVTP